MADSALQIYKTSTKQREIQKGISVEHLYPAGGYAKKHCLWHADVILQHLAETFQLRGAAPSIDLLDTFSGGLADVKKLLIDYRRASQSSVFAGPSSLMGWLAYEPVETLSSLLLTVEDQSKSSFISSWLCFAQPQAADLTRTALRQEKEVHMSSCHCPINCADPDVPEKKGAFADDEEPIDDSVLAVQDTLSFLILKEAVRSKRSKTCGCRSFGFFDFSASAGCTGGWSVGTSFVMETNSLLSLPKASVVFAYALCTALANALLLLAVLPADRKPLGLQAVAVKAEQFVAWKPCPGYSAA
ncbi:hypothetical protein AK812_SmicGene28803 [Symbiodinium microadriaticum]|uniref:Uncharacterized protein n=1 Tax=Symbiodinium microadriaticum TaxID=2951 RepID=A0A1Q9D3F7_SYMMI|nr:hypothetical protein AK812_SmicGene28803 [Symbiodinium microadriaticum]